MSDPNEVLFQVTRATLDTGLRGFPVGSCMTSAVSPTEGVSYVGYPIMELAYRDPEEIAYLLYNRELPTPEQLADYKKLLAERTGLPKQVLDILKTLPKEGHPMEWLITGLVLCGMVSKTGDWLQDAYNVTAKTPELIAAIFRIRQGWGDPIPPKPELGLIENFVHMLGVPGGDTKKLEKLLRVFYVLHMDHGGGNLSTFVGKAVASSHTDMWSSLAGGMAGLYGPLHGRANQECIEAVMEIGTPDPKAVEEKVRATLAAGGVIAGFGHAVLRAEDPRAKVQYELGEELCPDALLFRTAVTMRAVVPPILKENPKIQNPYPNVDAVSGTLLHACGLTNTDYYTLLFGLSRLPGIAAQIVDERVRLRGGKGVPIYRPKYVALNQPPRSLTGQVRAKGGDAG
jgi:citrate synthase